MSTKRRRDGRRPDRRPDLLGSLPHALGLARSDERDARELRLRVCALQAGGPRARDEDHGADRGGALRGAGLGDALGLGELPGVHGLTGAYAEGDQHHDLLPAGPAHHARAI